MFGELTAEEALEAPEEVWLALELVADAPEDVDAEEAEVDVELCDAELADTVLTSAFVPT